MVELIINRSKRYDQVTWAMAHDSHTCQPQDHYTDDTDVPMNVDQTQPVSAQLAGGIRAVRISTGTYKYQYGLDTVILQHGTPQKWGGLCVFGTLHDYLVQVRDFLVANPNEIVTIIDEGDANGYRDEDPVTAPKDGWGFGHIMHGARVSDNKPFSELVVKTYNEVFKDSGIRFYEPHGPVADLKDGKNWPTLQSMIDKKQRLVVFTHALRGPKWMLPSYYQLDNEGNVNEGQIGINLIAKTDDLLIEDANIRPDMPVILTVTKSTPDAPLAILNHYLYDYKNKAFDIKQSSRYYSKWVVGDLLIESTLRFIGKNEQRPNFLNVDFYQGVKGATSCLIPLVNALNLTPIEYPVGQFYKASLRLLANYMRYYPIQDTNGLRTGIYYKLLSIGDDCQGVSVSGQPKQPCYLNINTLQQLELSPESSHIGTDWVLIYNTPGPGFSIVHFGENSPNSTKKYINYRLRIIDAKNGKLEADKHLSNEGSLDPEFFWNGGFPEECFDIRWDANTGAWVLSGAVLKDFKMNCKFVPMSGQDGWQGGEYCEENNILGTNKWPIIDSFA